MPRLADLVLQSHHLNQQLAQKNETSPGRVLSHTVKQGSSAGLTTTRAVAEEAGGDSIFQSVVEDLGVSTASEEGVDYPQLERMVIANALQMYCT